MPTAIFLMGPTASGKTGLAVALQSRLPVEIISVDAAQVYRGLDIGTAKPSPEIRAVAPHRLIDICDPTDSYSAARFCNDAIREMHAIASTGRIPLLVGGTIFYFHALEHGLSALPRADPEVRRRLLAEAARIGWRTLHARLHDQDPEIAARIQPGDRHRIQRALEVMEISGRPTSELQTLKPGVPLPYHLIRIVIAPDQRTELHDRIATRFQNMLACGLIGEAAALFARTDIARDAPVLRIVGYRQIGEYLLNKIHYNEMVAQANAATRQLAKRQLTWLRHYPEVQWFSSDGPDCAEEIAAFIQQNMEAGVILGRSGGKADDRS